MEFIKILFNIAFTVLPLLLLLLLQIPAARTTTRSSENKFQNAETTTTTTSATATTTTTIAFKQNLPNAATTSTTTPSSTYNKNKNNTTTTTLRELRKHEQILDNSIDFTVDPCDDFYQYACGEWKQQFYPDNTNDQSNDHANDHTNEPNINSDNNDSKHNDHNADDAAATDNYDRTLAMIDYLADKEVLKYFNKRNITKNLNNTTTTANAETTTTTTTSSKRSQATTTTKEPDFIIKVNKYYKSCIAIQQYEPIKYLEWLELNEHVKWPSLINTTTNSEEHKHHDHDHEHHDDHHQHEQQKHNANTKANKFEDLIMDEETEQATEESTDDHDQDLDKDSWITTLAILRKYGLNGIFIEEIIYNTKTFPSKLLLGFNKPISQGGFKSLKNEHLKIIVNNLQLQLTAEDYKKLWLKLTKFEWQLTKLNDVSDELGTTLISLEQLPVPWLSSYMKVMFNQSSPLDTNMRLVITNVAYFMALDELLQEYDNDFLNQYLQIRFLWHLYQQEPQQFTPLDCIQHIKRFMPLAFEWIYEQQHDHLIHEIPKIQALYHQLRQQFNLSLYQNKNNFDSSVLEKLVNKLESVQLKIGSFVDIDRSEFFYENRKFYLSLKLSSREYYFNHLKMLKFNFDALHFGLRTITSHSLFYDMQEYHEGLTSAPHFNQRLNSLHIPFALLQPPLYHPDFPDIYKYSTLGFILGQTLMYGFNLNAISTEDHLKLFQQVKCLRFMDPLEINDKIADVSGLRLAYHSYFHNTPDHNLIANRKKFFLNFAHLFCALPSSDDDLGRSHVNYALAQFPEFAKTFECSTDSHMNPHEKCYLWD